MSDKNTNGVFFLSMGIQFTALNKINKEETVNQVASDLNVVWSAVLRWELTTMSHTLPIVRHFEVV